MVAHSLIFFMYGLQAIEWMVRRQVEAGGSCGRCRILSLISFSRSWRVRVGGSQSQRVIMVGSCHAWVWGSQDHIWMTFSLLQTMCCWRACHDSTRRPWISHHAWMVGIGEGSHCSDATHISIKTHSNNLVLSRSSNYFFILEKWRLGEKRIVLIRLKRVHADFYL